MKTAAFQVYRNEKLKSPDEFDFPCIVTPIFPPTCAAASPGSSRGFQGLVGAEGMQVNSCLSGQELGQG